MDNLEAGEEESGAAEGVYKVKPLLETQFDERAGEKERKKEERQKKRASQSQMMKFIANEYRYLIAGFVLILQVKHQKKNL